MTRLAPIWEYRTGDMTTRTEHMNQSATQGTPILVNDALVFCTPFNEVIALDPASGAERWRFDPGIDLGQDPANQFVCRGVTHWRDADATGMCADRIFIGTNDARLIALDAATGSRCTGFGTDEEVRIDPGHAAAVAGRVPDHVATRHRWGHGGGWFRDRGQRTGGGACGFGAGLRCQDACEARWEWDPIPRTVDDPAAPTWQGGQPPVEGHANAWAPMSVDEERGLVFVPTSSPSPDFYGGLRPGDNRHANSVVALEVATGEVRWSFQTVHHDIWDYDVPAQPGLYSVWRDGALHDVVAQVTKTGFVFVLDRDTGEPFLPVEERPVPQTGAPGEWLSPTQPFPVAPPPIVPNRLSPGDAFGLTLFDRLSCRSWIAESVADGLFTPPSEQGTLLYPFTGGGANWGGAAYDPMRNLLIVNMNNLAHHIQLIPGELVEHARRVFHDQEVSPQTGAPFGMKRELLLSPLGLPCTPPPWGVLAAVDLASGEIVWRTALGEVFGVPLGPPGRGRGPS